MKLNIKVKVEKVNQKFIYVLEQHIRDFWLKDLAEHEVSQLTFDIEYNVDDTEFDVYVDYEPK